MEETLGKRIAANRKRLSLTQDALAEQLGVTAQAVSKWENDQSCPDITMLPKLARIFGVSTDELLGIPPKELSVPEPPPAATDVSAETSNLRQALTSPGASFGVWLFLTGVVFCITRLRNMLMGLEDIAIACAVFVFGLFGFFRRLSLLRLGCAAVGGLFVLNLLLDTSLAGIDWTIPLAGGIALFGLDLFLGALRRPGNGRFPMPAGHQPEEAVKNDCTYEENRFFCITRFGEGERLIQLPVLAGGRGDVTFGELTIDLSACGSVEADCPIELSCAFGSLELLIPRKYRAEAVSSAAFGSVEEKGIGDPNAKETIRVHCSVRFGQITIRYI